MSTNAKNISINAQMLNDAPMVANIIAVWNERVATLSPSEFAGAVGWYPSAYGWCAEVAKTYGLPVETVAGIVAALSPNLNWNKNKEQALRFIEFSVSGKPLVGFMAYPANVAKAKRIFDGESPLNVLGGDKVRSFYRNLLLDDTVVTIDRHALSISLYGLGGGKSGSMVTTSKGYDVAAQAYKTAAKILGIEHPYIVQSVTWTYKAINGGKVE